MKASAPHVHNASSSGEREPTSDPGLRAERGHLARMSDAELITARDHARKMAHEAPGNLFLNADGSGSLGNSTAWARWSAEWARLADEADKRALRR